MLSGDHLLHAGRQFSVTVGAEFMVFVSPFAFVGAVVGAETDE